MLNLLTCEYNVNLFSHFIYCFTYSHMFTHWCTAYCITQYLPITMFQICYLSKLTSSVSFFALASVHYSHCSRPTRLFEYNLVYQVHHTCPEGEILSTVLQICARIRSPIPRNNQPLSHSPTHPVHLVYPYIK